MRSSILPHILGYALSRLKRNTTYMYVFSQKYKNTKVPRPDGLAEWIKRARTPSYVPSIPDATEYGNKWYAWWYSLQPASRYIEGNDRLSRKGCHDLTSVVVCGRNGFLNVVRSLSWWRNANESSGMKDWDDVVADVIWVLQHHSS
jgi:hypothetical protein